jgi:hypothetical protein
LRQGIVESLKFDEFSRTFASITLASVLFGSARRFWIKWQILGV